MFPRARVREAGEARIERRGKLGPNRPSPSSRNASRPYLSSTGPKRPFAKSNTARIRLFAVVVIFTAGLVACGGTAESAAAAACAEAEAMAERSPRLALEMLRRLQEEMPTAGTVTAVSCVAPLKQRMGRVRTLTAVDRTGEPETIEGCAWAVDAMEVFSDAARPPFRIHWGRRLMARCAVAVGRAWTRAPDDPKLRSLHERMVRLSREK